MADDNPNQLKGSACTVTLDPDARTLTFEHRGWFLSKAQKKSPIVVPFDEITAVESDFGIITGWFRIQRKGYAPWQDGVATDPHGLNCPCDPTEFAQRVRAAVGLPDAPAPEPVEQPPEPPEAEAAPEGGEPEKKGLNTAYKVVDGVLDILRRF